MPNTPPIYDGQAGDEQTPPELEAIERRLVLDATLWALEAPAETHLEEYARRVAVLERPPEVATDTAADRDADARLRTLDLGVLEEMSTARHVAPAPRARRPPVRLTLAVVLLVAALALSVLARFAVFNPPHHGAEPTATASTTTPTATSSPTATATPPPTATPEPSATPQPPAALVPLTATLRLQPNGDTITYVIRQACGAGSFSVVFIVLVKFSHSPPGTVTFTWRHYDGASPGEPPSSTRFSVAPSDDPTAEPMQVPTRDADYNGDQFTEEWDVQSDGFTGSTARWGDQFVITQINGHTLATPITSDVIHVATGC